MSAPPTHDLFDRQLRRLRRDRAARMGGDMFLLERVFDECFDRLTLMTRQFDRALLIGCPSPDWPQRLRALANCVEIFDPGPQFAAVAQGTMVEEDRHDFGVSQFDLCLAIGTLDTVNDLPFAMANIRRALAPDAPFVGAMVGGNSLTALRAALIEADRSSRQAAARTHPRIEPSSLAGLLAATGFVVPVVDVDRVGLRYRTLRDLVRDLRTMAATSQLSDRPPAMSKAGLARAAEAFVAFGDGERTLEQVDLLHFIAWSPATGQAPG